MAGPDPSEAGPGKIDKVRRRLKPPCMFNTERMEVMVDSMPDFKSGGIDAILAELKPEASKPIVLTDVRTPCEGCKAFDLIEMGRSYTQENTMCPKCRKETGIGSLESYLVRNCLGCNKDIEHLYAGYAATNTLCPLCRQQLDTEAYSASVLGKLRDRLAQYQLQQAQARTDPRAQNPATKPILEKPGDLGMNIPSTATSGHSGTGSQILRQQVEMKQVVPDHGDTETITTSTVVRRQIEKMDIIDNSLIDFAKLTPRVRLELRRQNARLREEIRITGRPKSKEIAKIRQKIREKEKNKDITEMREMLAKEVTDTEDSLQTQKAQGSLATEELANPDAAEKNRRKR